MTWRLFLLHIWLMLHSACCTELNAETSNKTFLYSNSVQSMVKLLKMENELIENLAAFSKAMQTKLDMINLYQQMLTHPTMQNEEMMEEYVGNALNGFALTRRLQQDWPKWIEYLTTGETQTTIDNMKKQLEQAPSEKDLQTAANGLLRIEKFYDLEASHMAKGWLLNQQYDSHLEAPDCLSLADQLYNRTEYSKSTHWYRTALRRYKPPYGQIYGQVLGLKRRRLYRKYAHAIARETHGLEKRPADKSEEEWKQVADTMLQELVANATSTDIKKLIDEYLAGDEQLFIEERAKQKAKSTQMQKGCQGLWPKTKPHRLNCRYVDEKSAFLRLAPLKMETLNLKPRIVLYHQVLHESEIQSFKEVALHPKEFDNQPEDGPGSVRLFKMHEFNAPITINVNRRIADMMGMHIADQQTLYLLNYGLGGYFKRSAKKPQQTKCDLSYCNLGINTQPGNRIATMLFYASNVSLGGATIFPKLQLAVKPKRGNALLWFHLNEAGEPDVLAEHAVCPVVMGSRWAISKCIEARQQVPKQRCLA